MRRRSIGRRTPTMLDTYGIDLVVKAFTAADRNRGLAEYTHLGHRFKEVERIGTLSTTDILRRVTSDSLPSLPSLL